MSEDLVKTLFVEAVAAHQAQDLEHASALYEKIIEISPHNAGALSNLGRIARANKDNKTALVLYERAAEAPDAPPEVHYNLGNINCDLNNIETAQSNYARAIEMAPNFTRAYEKLSLVEEKLGNIKQAASRARDAAVHSVNDQRLFFRAGRLYERLGGIDDAIGLYRKALAIDAEFDDAATRLAQLLFRRAKGDEAVALLDGVLKRNPQDPTALQNLGLVFRSTGHYAKALNAFQSSHKLAPEREILRVEVANCLINLGRAREGGALLKGMLETPQGRRVGASGYLMALLYDPTLKPSFICEEHLRLTADWPSLGRKNVRRKHGQRKSGRRRALRVGYLTADFFGNHPVAQFIAPLIKAHADEKYGIHTIAYDAHPRHDATASTMSSLCDVRNLSGLDDEAAAELIKKDDLDLLVDLSGHTSGRRLPMLGLRLAPAQACFIGYPSTTGFADVDYLIADEKVVPAGHDDLYSEKIARLPESFLCFRPPPKMPTPNKKHKDEIVFGSLNQLPKINAALFAYSGEDCPLIRLKVAT